MHTVRFNSFYQRYYRLQIYNSLSVSVCLSLALYGIPYATMYDIRDNAWMFMCYHPLRDDFASRPRYQQSVPSCFKIHNQKISFAIPASLSSAGKGSFLHNWGSRFNPDPSTGLFSSKNGTISSCQLHTMDILKN